jgi:hypothetical protein
MREGASVSETVRELAACVHDLAESREALDGDRR